MRTLGIDIGATSVKGGIVEDGKIVLYKKCPTNAKRGLDAILHAIHGVIEALLPEADEDTAIGVSSTGDINPVTGEVIYATDSMPSYAGLNLVNEISGYAARPVSVINDCIAALIGEWKAGAAVGCRNVVMLTLGTGVGGAVMVNGKLLLGENYRACRLGHISLYKNGRKCSCGKYGCAEAYISATGLLETARQMGRSFSDCNEIFACGDADFIDRVVDAFTSDLALLIGNLTAIFDAEKIIIGGGMILMSEYWMDELKKKTAHIAPIEKAKLGNDSGIIGAVCLTDEDFIKKEGLYERV